MQYFVFVLGFYSFCILIAKLPDWIDYIKTNKNTNVSENITSILFIIISIIIIFCYIIHCNFEEKNNTIFEYENKIEYYESILNANAENPYSNTLIEDTDNSYIVYITKTGSKYHRAGCSYLRSSKIEITLKEAKNKGYTACSRCNP